MKVSTVRLIVLARATLHNFFRRTTRVPDDDVTIDTEDFVNGVVVEGDLRSGSRGALQPLRGSSGRVQSCAKQLRIQL